MEMDELSDRLAQRLKTLRSERGWSLNEAALRTGVSKAMLGQIERGESSPTLATLWKIATGFNLAFSAFLPQMPAASAPWAPLNNQDIHTTSLCPWDAELALDILLLEMAPGARSTSSPHQTGVIEHVLVISGTLELTVAGQIHRLCAGEALRFAADCEHSYYNPGDEPLRLHDLIHYPR